jgi:hypothetical protein
MLPSIPAKRCMSWVEDLNRGEASKRSRSCVLSRDDQQGPGDSDSLDSRVSGSFSQAEAKVPEDTIPWSLLEDEHAKLFWKHWSPIEGSLARIDDLLLTGAPVTGEEYEQWDQDYKTRTQDRYEDAPDRMADQLSSWMSEHPNYTIPELLADFGRLSTVIKELQEGEHMPVLFPRLDQANFDIEWSALKSRVKRMTESMGYCDLVEVKSTSDDEPEGKLMPRMATSYISGKEGGSNLSLSATAILWPSDDGVKEIVEPGNTEETVRTLVIRSMTGRQPD